MLSVFMRRGTLPAAVLVLALGCTDGAHTTTPPSAWVRQAGHERLVVFVHGVLGSADATWRHAGTGAYWPTLLAEDPAFADFDVFVVNYETPAIARASTIEEIAQRVGQQLTDLGAFSRYQQVHFITHSMGGLVVKRLLVDLNRPLQLAGLRRARSVVLISTPSQGAGIADVASWLSLNPQLKDMAPADLNAFLQSLENQWQNLLRDRDGSSAQFPRVYCAYETKPTGPVMVVSRVYAQTRCDANPYPIDLDHSAIVKPPTRDADPYPWARQRLLETAALPDDRVAPHGTPTLTVRIHQVAFDRVGELVAAQQFAGAPDGTLPEDVLVAAARWITDRVAGPPTPVAPVRVRLHVPADLAAERVRVETPARDVEVNFWLIGSGGKVRLPLDHDTLRTLGRDFHLEIRVPGYGAFQRQVVWGRALDETVELAAARVTLGVEEIAGEPAGLSALLGARLLAHPRVRVVDPRELDAMRKDLERHHELIARQPEMQMPLRSLGVDYVVSGQVDRP
jgi:hypothetical protein